MTREYTSSGYKDGKTINHWGVTLDADKPTTGVIGLNEPAYFDDEMFNGIDLAWEEHVEECAGKCDKCRCNHPYSVNECDCRGVEAHDYEPIEGEHDGCGPDERGTILAGSWKKDADGEYAPDPDAANAEYAAIVGEQYIQVLWSKRVVKVRSLCSPCYPGQADVSQNKIVGEDEPGYLAYDLPEDFYEKEEV